MRMERRIRDLWMAICALCMLCVTSQRAQAQTPGVDLTVNPNPFQAGQVVAMVLTLENLSIGETPIIRLPEGLQIAGGMQRQNQFQFSNGVRMLREQIVFPITATQPGEYKIESQALDAAGTVKTPELIVKVLPAGQTPATDDDAIDPLAPLLQLQMGKTEFYVGELVPITATLFIPRRTQLERPGLVDISKDGFAIQRFPQGAEQAMQSVGGQPYVTYTFRSTLSALKPGKLKVGPAKMEIIYHVPLGGGGQQGLGLFGILQMESKRVVVQAREVPVNVLPLPTEGRPASFTGAVGEFTLNASTGITEATVGDPVPVDLSIEGQGNFDSIQSPVLTQPKGWKSFPARRYTVGDENVNTRDLMNQRIGFSVVLVPQEVIAEVPAFEFAYFNPESKKYVVMRSNALPITVKPGQAPAVSATTTPSASGPVSSAVIKPPAPVANLTDIVVTLPPTATWAAANPALLGDPRFLTVNAVLAAGFFLLVGWLLFSRWKAVASATAEHQRAELFAALSAAGLSKGEFYRRVARLLQVSDESSVDAEAVRRIMLEYERANFTADQKAEPLSSAERSAVLEVVRRLKPAGSVAVSPVATARAISVMLLLATQAQGALTPEERFEAAVSALEKKNYAGARQAAESLAREGMISPELFQIAGHAAYKEGQPGLAAMWYQRAQLFPRPSVELRQNLKHVEEKIHVLMPPRDESLLSYALVFSRNQWALILAIGGWLAVFSIVLLAVGARGAVAGSVGFTLVMGLFAVVAGAVGLLGRPNYGDLKDLAFVTKPKTQVHTSATVVSGSVIQAPEGSVVRRVSERGTWTYVEVAQGEEKLRGWVPSDSLAAYWPYDPGLLP